MVLEFPGDPACSHLERQYMLGDDLLVAPAFGAAGEVDYYVPEGTWTHFLTGERVTGPCWRHERHGFLSIPLLARPGAVIPEGAVEDRPGYDYADGVTLRVYELPDGAEVTTTIPAENGALPAQFVTSRAAGVVRVRAAGARPAWRVLLAGLPSVASVTGGTAVADERGTLVLADQDTLTIHLIRSQLSAHEEAVKCQ
jgi:alpha-D-xyloside xylohydrolase